MVEELTDLLETTPEEERSAASDFAAVFRSQQRAIYQLAFALSGDRALAEDATAEVFSKVYRQWNVKRPDDPAAYLRRAVINQVHGRFRRLREPVEFARIANAHCSKVQTHFR